MDELTFQPTHPPMRLHHFGLSVPDQDAAVAWYTEKLGFRRGYDYGLPDPEARVAFLSHPSGGFRVELFEVAGSDPLPDSRRDLAADLRVQGLKHVSLAVEELDAAVAALRARGVEFLGDPMEVPDSGGERFAFLRDPFGNLIELYQPRPALDEGEPVVRGNVETIRTLYDAAARQDTARLLSVLSPEVVVHEQESLPYWDTYRRHVESA